MTTLPAAEPLVDVIVEDPRWAALDLDVLTQRAARATLARLGLAGEAEIAVLAADDAKIAELNGAFRGKPRPTNVLSWPAEALAPAGPGLAPPPPQGAGPHFLGDVALAWETCSAEAEAGGMPLEAHVTHLTVHAILHLLGYDHDDGRDAALMERIETEILAQLGLPSPY